MEEVCVSEEALYESPCGNLVDGLPHACHKEQLDKKTNEDPQIMVN